MQLSLAIPCIFPQLCQIAFKVTLWPVDLSKYKNCTFDYGKYQNDLLSRLLNFFMLNDIESLRQEASIKRLDAIWLASNMDFDLNIRINQVASSSNFGL